MTYGEYRRTKSRVNVLRGYHGNESKALTFSAPVNASHTDIKSGMLISLNSSGEWVKGAALGKIPYIAYHDASDTDVSSSGLLLGLSCAGDFEIETQHFNAASATAYARDQYLVADTVTAGQVTNGDTGSGIPSVLSLAADIVGYVTQGARVVQSPDTSNGLISSSAQKYGSTTANTVIFEPSKNVNSQAAAGMQKTLTFITRWQPRAYTA